MGNPPQTPQSTPLPSLPVKADGESPANESYDSLAILSFLSQEVISLLGKDFLGKMPRELMERYCAATVDHNHPTGELLYRLIINFMIAYSESETNAEALKAFDFLDYLADKPC